MGFTDRERFHSWSPKLVTEAERSREDGAGHDVASCADALWARHAFVGEERVTSPKEAVDTTWSAARALLSCYVTKSACAPSARHRRDSALRACDSNTRYARRFARMISTSQYVWTRWPVAIICKPSFAKAKYCWDEAFLRRDYFSHSLLVYFTY